MKFNFNGIFTCLALAGLYLSQPVSADDDIICGTPDDPSLGLQKSSPMQALPTVKVYQGVLKAYVFRIDFADAATTVTTADIDKNNVIINDFYKAMSRNLFSWQFIVHPTPLVMPGTAASYDGNFNALRADISTAVTATGLKRCSTSNPTACDYSVYNVTFPKLNLGWSGLSSGGTSGQNYMNGSYGTGVTSHEMGHTVGLAHAHSIEAGATDIFGTPGTTSQHVEYGNPFDVMGRGGATGHFNICYKYRDGWTDGAGVEVKEVTQSGVFRLYGQDTPDHKGRLLGIRVPSGDAKYGYWFEYHTNSANGRKGAHVMVDGWNGTSSRADTWLLDLTPATTTDNDGLMAPNMELKDNWGTTTFKTLGMSAVAGPEGWVDVQVAWNGIVGIAPKSVNLMRRGWDAHTPTFSVAGRAVNSLISMQTLVLRPRDGQAPQLLLSR